MSMKNSNDTIGNRSRDLLETQCHPCSHLKRQLIRHTRTAESSRHGRMFPAATLEERKRHLTHSLAKPKQFLKPYELFIYGDLYY